MSNPKCALCGKPATTAVRVGGGGTVPACAGCAAPVPRNPRNKYSAQRTTVDGRTFASKKEARRYGQLKLREAAGEIRDLLLQVRFPLEVNGVLVCTYVADFVYLEASDWALVVEDTKGVRTDAYRLKAKLMRAVRGITIRET